jgi:hypothetical protein
LLVVRGRLVVVNAEGPDRLRDRRREKKWIKIAAKNGEGV